jgi:hypothetical protein
VRQTESKELRFVVAATGNSCRKHRFAGTAAGLTYSDFAGFLDE